jgi:farnesyl-diphosphate farnesyltransferase
MTPQSPDLERLQQRVARSFHLSLRFLPGLVRPTLSLAYLLARASDSIADVASAPEELRIHLLEGLPASWPRHFPSALERLTGAERELLEAMPTLLEMLCTSPDRLEIESVWNTIRSGQIFDLKNFPSPSPLPLEEARHYTGLVAGCVGEFWTDICFKHIPDYSRKPCDEMRRLGFSFGCGLQWINILRDRHADAEAGRIYFTPELFPEVLATTRSHLSDGRCYSDAVRPRRLRAACRLPLELAEGTLKKIESNPSRRGIKVGRAFVWKSLALSLLR